MAAANTQAGDGTALDCGDFGDPRLTLCDLYRAVGTLGGVADRALEPAPRRILKHSGQDTVAEFV